MGRLLAAAGAAGTAADCFRDGNERRSGRSAAGLADAGLADGEGCDRFSFGGMSPMPIGKVFLSIKWVAP